MPKFRVYRSLADTYGKEEIVVEAKDISEVSRMFAGDPVPDSVLAEVYWLIDIEEIEGEEG